MSKKFVANCSSLPNLLLLLSIEIILSHNKQTTQTMKRLFLLSAIAIIAICSSSCGSSQSGEPTRPELPARYGWYGDPLYGDVESVTISNYQLEVEFGEVVRGDIKSYSKYNFNEAGDVVERAEYNSDGSLCRKEIYKYDYSGNEIEESW